MLTAAAMALALFADHATVHKTNRHVAGWTMHVRTDRFTGAVSCSADRGAVKFQGPVVVFALGPYVDTSEADYRLNTGAAHSVRDVAFRVRTLGAPLTLEPIDNPSRGLVVLPAAEVMDADVVWIRATPRSAPRRFVTAGLKDVAAQEQLATCG